MTTRRNPPPQLGLFAAAGPSTAQPELQRRPQTLERDGAMTGIEWTEETINVWAGCSKVSPGCQNCYAIESAAHVERCGTSPHYAGLTVLKNGVRDWALTSDGRAVLGYNPRAASKILSARAGRLLFLNSMSDFWHPDAPDEWRRVALDAIRERPDVVVQVLTKRPDLIGPILARMNTTLPENFWLGVTIESEYLLAERLRLIRAIPALVRFLSIEPMLNDVVKQSGGLAGVHWVIAGGESGKGARPMKVDWVRRLRDHCQQERVAFFFKQWGLWRNNPIAKDYATLDERKKHDPKGKGGSLLDGVLHHEFPALFWERWASLRRSGRAPGPVRLSIVEETPEEIPDEVPND